MEASSINQSQINTMNKSAEEKLGAIIDGLTKDIAYYGEVSGPLSKAYVEESKRSLALAQIVKEQAAALDMIRSRNEKSQAPDPAIRNSVEATVQSTESRLETL